MSDQASRIGQEQVGPKTDPTALTTDALQREIAQLRELMETKLAALTSVADERDLRYQQRWEAQQIGIREALSSAEKAVTKAENAMEKRFDGVNEFRETLSDQAAAFLTRVEYNAAHQALIDKIDDAKVLIAQLTAAQTGEARGRQGISDSLKLGISILGAAILLIGFFIAQQGGP